MFIHSFFHMFFQCSSRYCFSPWLFKYIHEDIRATGLYTCVDRSLYVCLNFVWTFISQKLAILVLKKRIFKSKQSLPDWDAVCALLVLLFWVQEKFKCKTHSSPRVRASLAHSMQMRLLDSSCPAHLIGWLWSQQKFTCPSRNTSFLL